MDSGAFAYCIMFQEQAAENRQTLSGPGKPRRAILKDMRTLVQIFLLTTLVACASPYRTVYTSAEGDHYIEERAVQGVYYVPDSVMYANIGFDPWWITVNPSLSFIYYNPNYYQYYLAAWYRLIYQPYYVYGRGDYAYWCPPYQVRHGHVYADSGGTADTSLPAPFINGREKFEQRDLWRSADNKSHNRVVKQSNGPSYKALDQNRSMTPFMTAPAKPSLSTPTMDMNPSSGFARPTPRSIPVGPGMRSPRLFPAPTKQ